MAVNRQVLTQDGSLTFFSDRFGEHYHSTFGAIRESQHIFIQSGFDQAAHNKSSVSVLEVGLGTGLNVLLTYLSSRKFLIDYMVVEAYPLGREEYSLINYPQYLKEDSSEILNQIHESPWNNPVRLADNFTFTKFLSTFENWRTENKFDLVYYDAFSAGKQPELWTPEIFKKIASWCNRGAVLVTYSVKGDVRWGLQAAGFQVEKIPGPLGGKREILRAVYQ